MASFLARALKLTGTAPDAFTDDEASPHEPNINLVAKAGIATGCAATKYCPTALVSREQMASFLARALKLAGTAPDAFTDDEQSIHEPNINLVAKAGVATGCGPASTAPPPTSPVARWPPSSTGPSGPRRGAGRPRSAAAPRAPLARHPRGRWPLRDRQPAAQRAGA